MVFSHFAIFNDTKTTHTKADDEAKRRNGHYKRTHSRATLTIFKQQKQRTKHKAFTFCERIVVREKKLRGGGVRVMRIYGYEIIINRAYANLFKPVVFTQKIYSLDLSFMYLIFYE